MKLEPTVFFLHHTLLNAKSSVDLQLRWCATMSICPELAPDLELLALFALLPFASDYHAVVVICYHAVSIVLICVFFWKLCLCSSLLMFPMRTSVLSLPLLFAPDRAAVFSQAVDNTLTGAAPNAEAGRFSESPGSRADRATSVCGSELLAVQGNLAYEHQHRHLLDCRLHRLHFVDKF